MERDLTEFSLPFSELAITLQNLLVINGDKAIRSDEYSEVRQADAKEADRILETKALERHVSSLKDHKRNVRYQEQEDHNSLLIR